MANSLADLAYGLFNRRQQQAQQPPQTTAVNPNILGTGMAANAANGLLMEQYRNQAAIAQATGEEFPTFEQWMAQRR